MAYRKRRRSMKSRRRPYRKRKRSAAVSVVSRGLKGIRKRRRRSRIRQANRNFYTMPSMVRGCPVYKLVYTDVFNLPTGDGVLDHSSYIFRANSCQDPDFSGLGQQPYGYDQIAQWFNSGTVLGSKITVQDLRSTTSNTTLTAVGIAMIPNDATKSIDLGDYARFTEMTPGGWPRTKKCLRLGIAQNDNMTGLINNNYISFKYSPRKWWKPYNAENQTFICTTSGSAQFPVDQMYYYVHSMHLDGSVILTNTKVRVTIEYIVRFSDRSDQPNTS